jgi:hypothetical protein
LFRKSWRFWDNIEEYGGARETTNDVTIWRIRVVCWVCKATSTHAHAHVQELAHTHTQTLICIAFPPQQWFEKAPHCYVIRTLSYSFLFPVVEGVLATFHGRHIQSLILDWKRPVGLIPEGWRRHGCNIWIIHQHSGGHVIWWKGSYTVSLPRRYCARMAVASLYRQLLHHLWREGCLRISQELSSFCHELHSHFKVFETICSFPSFTVISLTFPLFFLYRLILFSFLSCFFPSS